MGSNPTRPTEEDIDIGVTMPKQFVFGCYYGEESTEDESAPGGKTYEIRTCSTTKGLTSFCADMVEVSNDEKQWKESLKRLGENMSAQIRQLRDDARTNQEPLDWLVGPSWKKRTSRGDK